MLGSTSGTQVSNRDDIKDLNNLISNILSDKSGVTTRKDIDLDNFDAAVRAVYYEKYTSKRSCKKCQVVSVL